MPKLPRKLVIPNGSIELPRTNGATPSVGPPGSVVLSNVGGLLKASINGGAYTTLQSSGAGGDTLVLGGDVTLTRQAANLLRIADSVEIFGPAIGTVPLIIDQPAGQTANLISLRVNGVSQFQVDPGGVAAAWQYNLQDATVILHSENSGGDLRMIKQTAPAANPGTDVAKLYFRDGTNAGTLKLVVRAGTAGSETTVLDNIPQV